MSHDWGIDGYGRDTHARVREINEMLRNRGYNTWFDEDRMTGNTMQAMCNGISQSEVFIAFITDNYCQKVAKVDKDN